MWLVSPLAGWDRNQVEVRSGPGGRQVSTETDTVPIYGLFAMVAHPRFVVNDFLFYAEPNDSDVLGNLLYLNVYGDPEAACTWNLGAGHMYHKIEPANEEIQIHVPMVKAGALVRIKPWGVTLNPYLGYAWERTDTLRSRVDNDSLLYGLTVDWRWRMLNLNVKYYYQDSLEDCDDTHTVRARFVVAFNRHWGAVARFDYMEHATGDDTSIMFGPVCVF
ncbi:MAG: hypothetical protein BWZ02_02275 [Lentisphaerae bacterium ADurb.BinA184]|nr:MAG: hypothetical protein BWZ02_02275 [Lentisphaerae bacterium ADurb.BinA184]